VDVTSDNLTDADNQQERLGAYLAGFVEIDEIDGDVDHESSETIRRTPRMIEAKIWSDLHGDVQSQAEMTWPLSERSAQR